MKKLVLYFALILACYGCTVYEDEILYTSTIYGTVIDYDTGNTLSNVAVNLYSGGILKSSTYTGTDGAFQFKVDYLDNINLTYTDEGNEWFTIVAECTGYQKNERTLCVDIKEESEVVLSLVLYKELPENTLPEVETVSAVVEYEDGLFTVLRGNIVSEGYPSYNRRGFVYSSYSDTPRLYYLNGFLRAENGYLVFVSGTGNGEFNAKLSPGTLSIGSYVRAFVESKENGIVYGATVKVKQANLYTIQELGIAVQCQDIGSGSYSSMKSLCENSTVGGFTDWRLPEKDEMSALYNLLSDEIGGLMTNRKYWSSTWDYYNREIWYMYGGDWYTCSGSNSNERYARAVRTLTE